MENSQSAILVAYIMDINIINGEIKVIMVVELCRKYL